jgi:DNA processing protein
MPQPKLNITPIHRGEAAYPGRLSALDMAPAELWTRGPWDERAPSVAIVGARAASRAGLLLAFSLSQTLAEKGVSIISGGAMGIDASAHGGALAGGGKTLVVLGTGVDVVYPRRHAPLFQQVVDQGGCLLSMFPLGTPPKPWHFPARNAIIAALADVVLVVESQLGSGSRITAVAGRKLGRLVLAVPGSPGTAELLREGARPARGAGDALRALGLCPAGDGETETEAAWPPGQAGDPAQPLLPFLEEEQAQAQRLRTALDEVPRDLGELCTRAGLSASTGAAAIIDLELQGFCTRLTGGRYIALEHAS